MNLAHLASAGKAAVCLCRRQSRAFRRLEVARAGETGFVSESLPLLAGVLPAAPESDALVILGRLLDSLPIPVMLTDCSNELRCVYGNAAWRAWVPSEKFPVERQPLPEIILGKLGDSPLLPILRQVCATGEAPHLRDFEYVGLAGSAGHPS